MPEDSNEPEELMKLKAQIRELNSKISARDAELVQLKAAVCDLEEKVSAGDKHISAQNVQIEASQKLLEAQKTVITSLKSVDPAEASTLRADLCYARLKVVEEQKRCKRLLELCENIGLPLPKIEADLTKFANDEYEVILKQVFEEKVQAAARDLAVTLQGHLRDEKSARREAERINDCFRLFSGVSEFERTGDGTRYSVSVVNATAESKVSFLIAWDETHMVYEPVDVSIPEGTGPGYLRDKIEFRLNQTPKFFSHLLSAVFNEDKSISRG